MVSLAAKPRTLAFPSLYSTGEKSRGGPGDRGPAARRAHVGSPSLPLELFPAVKPDGIHFSAVLKVFCFVHVANFALFKSPIITHSLSIFFKYYEKRSTRQEFFPLLRGGRDRVLVLFLGSGEVVVKERRWESCSVRWPGWQGLLRWRWLEKGWSSFSSLSRLAHNHQPKARNLARKGNPKNVPRSTEPRNLAFAENILRLQ